MGHESHSSKNNILILENNVAGLESQNRVYQEQLDKLSKACKIQEGQIVKKNQAFQQLCQEYSNKEIQWANTLEKEQNQLTNDFNARIDEMGQVIDEKDEAIKEISLRLTEAQLENTALKEINLRLKD